MLNTNDYYRNKKRIQDIQEIYNIYWEKIKKEIDASIKPKNGENKEILKKKYIFLFFIYKYQSFEKIKKNFFKIFNILNFNLIMYYIFNKKMNLKKIIFLL